MYTLQRKTGGPVMRVAVDQAQGDGDGGFHQGGVFEFAPKGSDGDSYQVSEHVARVVMGDSGLAPHFTCSPPLPALRVAKPAAPDAAVAETQDDQSRAARTRRTRTTGE